LNHQENSNRVDNGIDDAFVDGQDEDYAAQAEINPPSRIM